MSAWYRKDNGKREDFNPRPKFEKCSLIRDEWRKLFGFLSDAKINPSWGSNPGSPDIRIQDGIVVRRFTTKPEGLVVEAV